MGINLKIGKYRIASIPLNVALYEEYVPPEDLRGKPNENAGKSSERCIGYFPSVYLVLKRLISHDLMSCDAETVGQLICGIDHIESLIKDALIEVNQSGTK